MAIPETKDKRGIDPVRMQAKVDRLKINVHILNENLAIMQKNMEAIKVEIKLLKEQNFLL